MLAQEWPTLETAVAGLAEIGREGVLQLEMPDDA